MDYTYLSQQPNDGHVQLETAGTFEFEDSFLMRPLPMIGHDAFTTRMELQAMFSVTGENAQVSVFYVVVFTKSYYLL